MAASRAAGPVTVDPGVAGIVRALDPEQLTEEEFDGLLVAFLDRLLRPVR